MSYSRISLWRLLEEERNKMIRQIELLRNKYLLENIQKYSRDPINDFLEWARENGYSIVTRNDGTIELWPPTSLARTLSRELYVIPFRNAYFIGWKIRTNIYNLPDFKGLRKTAPEEYIGLLVQKADIKISNYNIQIWEILKSVSVGVGLILQKYQNGRYRLKSFRNTGRSALYYLCFGKNLWEEYRNKYSLNKIINEEISEFDKIVATKESIVEALSIIREIWLNNNERSQIR